MTKERLSKKQKLMFDFVENFINQNGFSPTFREIASGLNYSSIATVATHIDNLVKLGWLTKTENVGRSLEITTEQKVKFTSVDELKKHIENKWKTLTDAQKNNIKISFKDLDLEKLILDIEKVENN